MTRVLAIAMTTAVLHMPQESRIEQLQGPRRSVPPIESYLELPRLDPAIRIATFSQRDMPVRSLVAMVASSTGLTVQYDTSVPVLDQRRSVHLTNASLEYALQLLLNAHGIAYTVLGPKQVLAYSDTAENHDKFAWSVREFPLAHADPKQLVALLFRHFEGAPGIRPIIVPMNRAAPTIGVRAVGEKMAVIAKLIAENDKR